MTGGRLELGELERLWAVPFGEHRGTRALTLSAAPPGSARAALEDVVARALERPPCVVAFSGGVDSSAVLALAAHVARSRGLPLPVALTNRFPEHADADETAWQELVVGHLGLDDWLRPQFGDELDMLGPVARVCLRAHGPLAPFNAHFLMPAFEQARGGSLLTGFGGDELFAGVWRRAAGAVLHERRRPRRDEWRGLAFAAAPRPLRSLARAAALPFGDFGWIRPHARRRLALGYAAWVERSPLSWSRFVARWWWPSRRLQTCLEGLDLLAGDRSALGVHPFAAPAVLSALASEAGATGPGTRAQGLTMLVGDLLPAAILQRSSKAGFSPAFFAGPSRGFAERWSGAGVDQRLVDVAALRREWRSPEPDGHSFTLLQEAWLHREGASALGE